MSDFRRSNSVQMQKNQAFKNCQLPEMLISKIIREESRTLSIFGKIITIYSKTKKKSSVNKIICNAVMQSIERRKNSPYPKSARKKFCNFFF